MSSDLASGSQSQMHQGTFGSGLREQSLALTDGGTMG